MSTPRLTDTSFVVLGLLDLAGNEATPYDLKRFAQLGLFDFWSVPHTQLYTECKRLAEGGLLSERQEAEGRRRRFYRLTEAGKAALEQWRNEPTDAFYELRDPSLLKLFFGGDPALLAEAQIRVHEAELEKLEAARAGADPENLPAELRGMFLAAEYGIEAERVAIRFWSRLLESD
jgi:DNA-binding PadR family transcriptional regulator